MKIFNKNNLFPAKPGFVPDVKSLLDQLSNHFQSKKFTPARINQCLKQGNFFLAGIFVPVPPPPDASIGGRGTQKIVGIASIYIQKTLKKDKAVIEDVVVDKNYRGRGYGKKLVKKLIKIAKKNKVKTIELTSASERKAANYLYKRVGFKKISTNFYRMEL